MLVFWYQPWTLLVLANPAILSPSHQDRLEITAVDPTTDPMCRICLESTNTTDNVLIANCCNCKGSHMYIHTNCRQTWISMNPDKGTECETCRQSLVISRNPQRRDSMRQPLRPVHPNSVTAESDYVVVIPVGWFQRLYRESIHSSE